RERQITLVRERLRWRDRNLPRRGKLVVLERVDAQLLFSHGASYFFFAGGRSVHTPSNTSAAMPMDSLSVGCGWIVLPISVGSQPISTARQTSPIRSPACGPTMPPPMQR